MYGDPELWHDLLRRLAQIAGDVPAGAGRGGRQRGPALRLLGRRAAPARLPAVRAARTPRGALAAVADRGVPRIHFGVGTGELLAAMGEAGAEVVGVDFRVSLTDARPPGRPGMRVQGNLDPALLFAPWRGRRGARSAGSSTRAARRPGHIFNLGHGVLPETDPDVLTRVVELVHEIPVR